MVNIPLILFAIIKVIIAFSVLILVHEFGHFIVAKKSGVWVEEFGLGLPPRLWGKKIGETIYSLNLLPIGGFVKLHGEEEEDVVTNANRSFVGKNKLTKIAITIAGIVMNLLLAVAAFALVYSINGIESGKIDVKILNVSANSPAEYAGIKVGDIIKKVGDREVETTDQFKKFVDDSKGKQVKIEVVRDGETKTLSLLPRAFPPEGEGPIGVEIGDVPEVYYPPVWQRPFYGIYYGFKDAFFYVQAVVQGLTGAVQQASHGQSPKGVAGPLAIVAIFYEIAKLGFIPLVRFVGIISVNLAVVNLIPFPPLDGYRIATTIVEKILGKKFLPKFESAIHTIGLILLLLLMVLLTVREIPMLIKAGSVSNFVNSILK
ncbi:MAG TPA: M50 family metallopeptidase [Patescibacteria group bacterium]